MTFAVTVLLGVSLLLPELALARNFRCDQVWSNASSKNNAADCFTNSSHVISTLTANDQIGLLILALIPLVLFVFGFLCCPTVCTCRYVCRCCGSYRRRPETVCCGGSEWDDRTEQEKNDAYPRSSVRRTKAAAVIVLVLAIAALILSVNGTSTMNDTYNDLFTQLKSILTFVSGKANSIRTLLTINSTQTLIPPLQEGFFNNITSKINDFGSQIDNGKKSSQSYVEYVNWIALVIGIVPILFLLFTVLFAVFDIRTCWPCLNLCCHYIFFIPYSLLGFVFLVLGLVLGDVCGERDLFVANSTSPGLISLAGVPLCEANLPFDQIKNDISSVIAEQTQNACNSFYNFCSSSQTTWSITNPQVVFQCSTLTSASVCTDFPTAYSISQSMTLLTGAPVACQNGTKTLSPCSFDLCGDYCTDPNVRNLTKTAATYLGYANNAYLAYTLYMAPLLSCTTLYSVALTPLNVCPSLILSLYYVGGAFLGYTIFFLAGMVILWRGQKRFFKLPSKEDEHDSELEEREPTFTDIKNTPHV